jgi:HJR/Mrr/RecB family endonuclease
VVLQCTLYTSPVDNSVVRQISAGRVHYQTEYGVVVTNNRYTESAKSLVATNKVHLLHHTNLSQLEQTFAGKFGQATSFAA